MQYNNGTAWTSNGKKKEIYSHQNYTKKKKKKNHPEGEEDSKRKSQALQLKGEFFDTKTTQINFHPKGKED